MNFFSNHGEEANGQGLSKHRLPGLTETELERDRGCAIPGTITRRKLCCLVLLKKFSLLSYTDNFIGALS